MRYFVLLAVLSLLGGCYPYGYGYYGYGYPYGTYGYAPGYQPYYQGGRPPPFQGQTAGYAAPQNNYPGPTAYSGENCGTPDQPKPCPPLPRHPLPYFPANRQSQQY
jgi:hypothetical protein